MEKQGITSMFTILIMEQVSRMPLDDRKAKVTDFAIHCGCHSPL